MEGIERIQVRIEKSQDQVISMLLAEKLELYTSFHLLLICLLMLVLIVM